MPLPDFIETRFPALSGWEYTVEPVYEVDIVTRGRGKYETRNLPVEYPRRRIVVRIPSDKQSDLILVNRWHHALRGRAVGFRVQDPSDFLSIDLDPYEDLGRVTYSETSPTDQPIVEDPADPGAYQLYKRYRIELDATTALDQLLPIYKPVEGTIRVANDSGVEQSSDRWRLDYTTGILETLGGFVGTPASWGGQFDLPMRFNSGLPLEVRDHLISEASFELLELPR